MHRFLLLVLVSSINAAAQTEQLIAVYHPSDKFADEKVIQVIEDAASQTLTLNIPAARSGWSTTIQLIGDKLSRSSTRAAAFGSRLTSFAAPLELSDLVKKQVHMDGMQEYEPILLEYMNPEQNLVYIWRKFLLINPRCEKILLPLCNNPHSVAEVMHDLTTQACAFPVAVVDLHAWLTQCCGQEW